MSFDVVKRIIVLSTKFISIQDINDQQARIKLTYFLLKK